MTCVALCAFCYNLGLKVTVPSSASGFFLFAPCVLYLTSFLCGLLVVYSQLGTCGSWIVGVCSHRVRERRLPTACRCQCHGEGANLGSLVFSCCCLLAAVEKLAFGVDGCLLLGEDRHAFDVKLFVNRGLISHGGLWSLA